jgi:hypothetical protein
VEIICPESISFAKMRLICHKSVAHFKYPIKGVCSIDKVSHSPKKSHVTKVSHMLKSVSHVKKCLIHMSLKCLTCQKVSHFCQKMSHVSKVSHFEGGCDSSLKCSDGFVVDNRFMAMCARLRIAAAGM